MVNRVRFSVNTLPKDKCVTLKLEFSIFTTFPFAPVVRQELQEIYNKELFIFGSMRFGLVVVRSVAVAGAG